MIKYSFTDNTVYGTEDVNNITANIIGAGVAPFPTKDTYSAEDLNGLTSALIGSGASANGCKCTLSGNTVTIAQGILYFENGVTLTVDSEGYSVTIPASTAGYIYAYFDNQLQTADIVFGESLPTSGYYVRLAAISAAGVLTDTRTPARARIATLGTNAVYEFEINDSTMTVSGNTYSIVLPVEAGKFNYIITTNTHIDHSYNYSFGIYDLKNECWIDFLSNSGQKYSNSFAVKSGEINVSVLPEQITISTQLPQYIRGLHMALV